MIFQKNHPRCICSYCNYMSDQAYIIKRHTMRHTQEGCKCDICGKVYKVRVTCQICCNVYHVRGCEVYKYSPSVQVNVVICTR
ncbi:hypothetical protein DPMN_022287 [Dreissena polymorpha]|uniref:C2H2-type domain-containing protein n=1 Tax=Dreissena polymorpha TaxID=45954 RepID=A0A9D4NNM9_DREPO|nr:hypothetical protein DPMN_022287 [Dreissena polymorpha]